MEKKNGKANKSQLEYLKMQASGRMFSFELQVILPTKLETDYDNAFRNLSGEIRNALQSQIHIMQPGNKEGEKFEIPIQFVIAPRRGKNISVLGMEKTLPIIFIDKETYDKWKVLNTTKEKSTDNVTHLMEDGFAEETSVQKPRTVLIEQQNVVGTKFVLEITVGEKLKIRDRDKFDIIIIKDITDAGMVLEVVESKEIILDTDISDHVLLGKKYEYVENDKEIRELYPANIDGSEEFNKANEEFNKIEDAAFENDEKVRFQKAEDDLKLDDKGIELSEPEEYDEREETDKYSKGLNIVDLQNDESGNEESK